MLEIHVHRLAPGRRSCTRGENHSVLGDREKIRNTLDTLSAVPELDHAAGGLMS